MPDTQIFFSYSRSDSDFALQLATDLRNAGADIWIDQLNIRPGLRWDSEIEQALKASHTILIVLSPAAVASNNVMDELSYALDEGKIIIPVIHEVCEVPFRIRRLQHIDFEANYDKGLQRLKTALGLSQPKTAEKTAEATVTEPKPKPKPRAQRPTAVTRKERVEKPAPVTTDTSLEKTPAESSSASVKNWLLGLSLLVLPIIVGWVWYELSHRSDPQPAQALQASSDTGHAHVSYGSAAIAALEATGDTSFKNTLRANPKNIRLTGLRPTPPPDLANTSWVYSGDNQHYTLTFFRGGKLVKTGAIVSVNSGWEQSGPQVNFYFDNHRTTFQGRIAWPDTILGVGNNQYRRWEFKLVRKLLRQVD